jgi:hypothetical protein
VVRHAPVRLRPHYAIAIAIAPAIAIVIALAIAITIARLDIRYVGHLDRPLHPTLAFCYTLSSLEPRSPKTG